MSHIICFRYHWAIFLRSLRDGSASIIAGSFNKSAVKPSTPLPSRVAENNKVCLRQRHSEDRRSMAGVNPISSIRSASSNISHSIALQSNRSADVFHQSLYSVATTMSWVGANHVIEGSWYWTPPVMVKILRRVCFASTSLFSNLHC